MKRRTLLQWFASIAAMLPLERLRLFAQPRELTPEAIATLHEIARDGNPRLARRRAASDDAADKFVAWTRGYREGVPLEHGYGHPRLQAIARSPVPRYIAQLGCARRGGAREGRALERARSRDPPRAARCVAHESGRPHAAARARQDSTSSPT